MDILSLLAGDRNQEVRDANSRCAQERWFFREKSEIRIHSLMPCASK